MLAKLTAVQPHQSSEVGTEFLVEASKDLGVGMFPKVGFEQGGNAVSDVNESSDNGVSKEESFENNSDVVTNVVTEKDVDKVSEREQEWGTAHGHRPSLKTPEVAKVSFKIKGYNGRVSSGFISPSLFQILETVIEDGNLEELKEGELRDAKNVELTIQKDKSLGSLTNQTIGKNIP